MNHDERLSHVAQRSALAPRRQSSQKSDGVPGRKPLTERLPSSPSGAAPVQQQRDPAAETLQMKWAAETERWMPAAMRPDLYSAPVQRMSGGASSPGQELPSDGGGKAMPEEVQAKMEGAFGADFSGVRIHEGPRSEALGARAYTQGKDVHFAPGEYQPGSQSGQELLGHELAHVVQQSQGRVSATTQAKGVAVNDDAGLETEADAMGAKAARGEKVGGGTSITEGPGRSTGGQFSEKDGLKSLYPSPFTAQRMIIRGHTDEMGDIDTEKIDFREFIGRLVETGDGKQLLYVTRAISSRGEPAEAVPLLRIITEVTGKALPGDQAERIENMVEMFAKKLSPGLFEQLADLLERKSLERCDQILELKEPSVEQIGVLVARWVKEEQAVKEQPISGDWGDTKNLVEPLINLINGVLEHGVLSRTEAGRRGLAPVGSADHGMSESISVNTLAVVGKDLEKARKVALESMTAPQRGSVSVSLERQDDPLKEHFPSWQDIKIDEKEIEKRLSTVPQHRRGTMESMVRQQLQLNRAAELYKSRLQGDLKHHIDHRAQGTILAILDKSTTGQSSTNVKSDTGEPVSNSSQEVAEKRAQIRPGQLHVLLVPDFIRPYFDRIVNPADVRIEFVGATRVDAWYKTGTKVGDLELEEVVAPDYVGTIAHELNERGVVATHIATANPKAP